MIPPATYWRFATNLIREGRPHVGAGLAYTEATLSPEDDLILALSNDLRPVQRVRIWPVVLTHLAFVVAMLLGVILLLGVRPDVAAADPLPQLVLREAILGLAAALLYTSAIREAYPGIWNPVPLTWGMAVLAILPGVAAFSMVSWDRDAGNASQAMTELGDFWRCALSATVLALPGILAHVWWLRSYGAVTSPKRAALSTGLAAGATAIFAFGISCPSQHWLYAGVTYPLVIGLLALLATLALPRWLRW